MGLIDNSGIMELEKAQGADNTLRLTGNLLVAGSGIANYSMFAFTPASQSGGFCMPTSTPNGLKVCPTCHIEHAVSEYYKSSSTKDGFKPQCKKCFLSSKRARWAVRGETLAKKAEVLRRKPVIDSKWCPNCDSWLPVDAFPKCKKISDGLNGWCKKCCNARSSFYYFGNAEALRKKTRDYRKNNREAVNALEAKRRAAKLNVGGSHTAAEWQYIKEFYAYTCLMCKRREPEIKLTKDHVVPITLGGNDSIGNIQPLCRSCNSRKNAKSIDLRQPSNRKRNSAR